MNYFFAKQRVKNKFRSSEFRSFWVKRYYEQLTLVTKCGSSSRSWRISLIWYNTCNVLTLSTWYRYLCNIDAENVLFKYIQSSNFKTWKHTFSNVYQNQTISYSKVHYFTEKALCSWISTRPWYDLRYTFRDISLIPQCLLIMTGPTL